MGPNSLPSVEDYIKAITAMMPEAPKPYSEVNPFYFDEQWADEYATAEFSPYFDEIMSDYLQEIDIAKERLGEDTDKFLTEMTAQKDTFMEKSGVELDRMIRGIREGYESRGLYFSGMKNRDIGEAQSDTQFATEDYMRQYEFKANQSRETEKRNLEDMALDTSRFTRDTERDKQAAISAQKTQLRDEAMDEYLLGAETYYSQPNWGSLI